MHIRHAASTAALILFIQPVTAQAGSTSESKAAQLAMLADGMKSIPRECLKIRAKFARGDLPKDDPQAEGCKDLLDLRWSGVLCVAEFPNQQIELWSYDTQAEVPKGDGLVEDAIATCKERPDPSGCQADRILHGAISCSRLSEMTPNSEDGVSVRIPAATLAKLGIPDGDTKLERDKYYPLDGRLVARLPTGDLPLGSGSELGNLETLEVAIGTDTPRSPLAVCLPSLSVGLQVGPAVGEFRTDKSLAVEPSWWVMRGDPSWKVSDVACTTPGIDACVAAATSCMGKINTREYANYNSIMGDDFPLNAQARDAHRWGCYRAIDACLSKL